VVTEKRELATSQLTNGGWDGMATQACMIPPGFSASSFEDPSLEYCRVSTTTTTTTTTTTSNSFTGDDQDRHVTEMIKPRFCHAEMCKVCKCLNEVAL